MGNMLRGRVQAQALLVCGVKPYLLQVTSQVEDCICTFMPQLRVQKACACTDSMHCVLQPYMREAWRVEPEHSHHQGTPLDELLLQLLHMKHTEELLADDGSSDTDDADGMNAMVTGLGLGGHIYPVYPGPAAAFAPICTDVPTLIQGKAAGFEAVTKVLAPVLR